MDGVQGSGKTTTANHIKCMSSDPTDPNLLSPPKTVDDIIVMSNKSHVMAFDNISGMSSEIADAFCRISTGAGISKRSLYSNDEEVSYNLLRPVILNGIGEPSTRPDFINRTVTIELEKLDPTNRISEAELKKLFLDDFPELLGGIYNLVSQVMAILPKIRKTNLERMTEFHRIGIALEMILNLPVGHFTKVYRENINATEDLIFANDDMCCAIKAYFERQQKFNRDDSRPELKGTATEILQIITKEKNRFLTGMPKSGSAFSNKLTRFEVILNRKGYFFEKDSRQSDRREMRIWFDDPNEIMDL